MLKKGSQVEACMLGIDHVKEGIIVQTTVKLRLLRQTKRGYLVSVEDMRSTVLSPRGGGCGG